MKIKQQKDIHKFLLSEFSKEKAENLFICESKTLEKLIENTSGKTKNQIKTLIGTILPRIALYKTFQSQSFSDDDTKSYIRKYMIDIVGAKKNASTLKMEAFPFFYNIYSKAFLRIMRTTDLQVSTQKCGKGFYDITITNCLWNNACIENNCPELCPIFCDVDDKTYGGLRKIGFTRTKTLGYGGDCCDFHFFKK